MHLGRKNTRAGTATMLLLAGMLGLSTTAHANAGTPLMWGLGLHLWVGNILIGIGEGLILARLFKARAIWLLIFANYFSAVAGVFLLSFAQESLFSPTLHNAWPIFWGMVVAAFLVTIVLEWPFVAFCLRGTPNLFRRSLRGSLIVQSISYILLFGWYALASTTSLYTENDLVEPSSMALPENAEIYYISDRDGDVYAGTFAEPGGEKVYDLDTSHPRARLVFRASPSTPGSWDLLARIPTEDTPEEQRIVVIQKVINAEVPMVRDDEGQPRLPDDVEWSSRHVPQVGSPEDSAWAFRTFGGWATMGLGATNQATGESSRLAYETPLGVWGIRNTTHMPGDKVLLQLGTNQICVYDPEAHQLAFVVAGRAPVVVLRKEIGHNGVPSGE